MSARRAIPWKHHVGWGAGLGAAGVVLIQVLTWLGLGLSHLTWILTFVLVAVFAVVAARSLGRRLGARPTLWQTVVLLAVMTVVMAVIGQLYMFVYINWVDPTWVDTVAEVWSAQMTESGAAPDEIDRNIDMFRRNWRTANVFTLGLVAFALRNFVVGLLVAVVAVVQPWKRRRRGD